MQEVTGSSPVSPTTPLVRQWTLALVVLRSTDGELAEGRERSMYYSVGGVLLLILLILLVLWLLGVIRF